MKENKKDTKLVIALGGSLILAGLCFYSLCLLGRAMHTGCLFFDPGTGLYPGFLICCMIFLSPFLLNKTTLKWSESNPQKAITIISAFALFFVFSILSLRSGMIADESGIRKVNLCGQTVEEYSYSDIVRFEMSVQYGIQYDIDFASGKSVCIESHHVIFFNAFRNDYNMMTFDKLLVEHATRNVDSGYRSLPENMKRFFKEDEVFRYFDRLFN